MKSRQKNEELTRQNIHLSNWTKNVNGQRGRGKGKSEVCKSQSYRRRNQDIGNIQSTIQLLFNGNIKSISVSIEDEYEREVNVTVEGPGLLEKEYKCTNEDVDEMVFCMDNFNVPVRGYHNIACRHPNLPRSNQVNKRRKEINATMGEVKSKHQVGMKGFGGH